VSKGQLLQLLLKPNQPEACATHHWVSAPVALYVVLGSFEKTADSQAPRKKGLAQVFSVLQTLQGVCYVQLEWRNTSSDVLNNPGGHMNVGNYTLPMITKSEDFLCFLKCLHVPFWYALPYSYLKWIKATRELVQEVYSDFLQILLLRVVFIRGK
jgi:hypothetical protein